MDIPVAQSIARIVVYHDKRMLRLYGNIRAIGNTTFTELSKMTDGEIAAYDEVIGSLRKKLMLQHSSEATRRNNLPWNRLFKCL